MSPLTPRRRQERQIPTASQRLILRRHIAQVLTNEHFRRVLAALRKTWGMQRVPLGRRSVWVLPQNRAKAFRERAAVEDFARLWFHGLGGVWLACRLIFDAEWEARALPVVVEEVATAMERAAADEAEWRLTYKVRSLSRSTAYYQGDAPFHPTAIWRGTDLASDLPGDKWRARPSADASPALTRSRRFIEVFAWTTEEDVRRAFRQSRQFEDNPLPRAVRGAKALLDNLHAYQRYISGARLDADEWSSVYRKAQRVASLLGFPPPKRPRQQG